MKLYNLSYAKMKDNNSTTKIHVDVLHSNDDDLVRTNVAVSILQFQVLKIKVLKDKRLSTSNQLQTKLL